MDIQPIVIGTAGHIDHGKSSLVRALTGTDPDRLKEEKERGLTIDLGFARFPLPDGRLVGIVDVPGHERFVRNMVAGATGIDLVVLVVAADDGVMPQTREHLDIMRLLGVERGFVALNKIDAVDPELVELALEDVQMLVAGTFLEGAPIVPVSAVHGQGMEELRATLIAAAEATPPRSSDGVFRMSVQRVFSKAGFGTVATGIPITGSVAVGDTLEVLPGGERGKVRGLQAYGGATDRARAGHSTAINFSDVSRDALQRGAVVAAPGFFAPTRMVAVRLTALASLERPVADRTAIRLHTGTADPRGELVLLDTDELAPGETGLCQIRLEDPVVCAPGDRFVLRRLSPVDTLGGGVILEESRHRLKRFKSFVLEELAGQETSLDSPLELVETVLARRGAALTERVELARSVKRTAAEVGELLAALAAEERAFALGKGERWIHADGLAQGLEILHASLERWFAENAHRSVIDVRELRRVAELDDALLDALLARAAESGDLVLEAGGRVRRVGAEVELDPAEQARREAVLAAIVEQPYQPPPADELAGRLRASEDEVRRSLEGLEDLGSLVRVAGGLYFAAAAVERAREAVMANCETHGHLEIPALRDLLGTSRKYLIPLLEYFDAQGVTMRQGAHRVLRRR